MDFRKGRREGKGEVGAGSQGLERVEKRRGRLLAGPEGRGWPAPAGGPAAARLRLTAPLLSVCTCCVAVGGAAAASDVPQDGLLLHGPFARKPKRIRTAFSPSQLLRLERAFEKNHYVVGAERKQLAGSLSLSETQVITTPRASALGRTAQVEGGGGGRAGAGGARLSSPPSPELCPTQFQKPPRPLPRGPPAKPVFRAPSLPLRLASRRPQDLCQALSTTRRLESNHFPSLLCQPIGGASLSGGGRAWSPTPQSLLSCL